MRKLLILTLILICSTFGYAEIISWDASSGLLPSDGSIEADSRFTLSGNSSWLSFQDGAMNVNDSSSTYQLNFLNMSYLPLSQNWAYQIELRMNSHSRPVFDFGATAGITQYRRSFLTVASDRVGFGGDNEFVNSQAYLMATTDGFHTYRVIKNSDIVSLYIDTFDAPVMSIAYENFPIQEYNALTGDFVGTFATGSGLDYPAGFAFVPEPATMLLLIGAIPFMRRRKA
jgi:hypothetical protein